MDFAKAKTLKEAVESAWWQHVKELTWREGNGEDWGRDKDFCEEREQLRDDRSLSRGLFNVAERGESFNEWQTDNFRRMRRTYLGDE